MNILIVGIGHHARRIYLPTFFSLKEKYWIINIVCLDLEGKIWLDDLILLYPWLIIKYISKSDIFDDRMNEIKKEFDINIIIVSTDPINHYQYILWAINSNIHCLTDKPIVLEEGIVSNKNSISTMKNKFKELYKSYERKIKGENKVLLCEIMCQRRYHKWYQLVHEKISEIFQRTDCPVTYINSFHSDWQRRFPDEIINQDYHPYNQWYGKTWHSGYHTIDIVARFVQSTTNNEKKIDNIDVYTQSAFPSDLIHQFNFLNYKTIFPKYLSHHNVDSYIEKTNGFWDVDTQASITFKSWKYIQTLASINILHNWFSQRNRISAEWRDLYKWNWRIRQEFIMIEQWPFQSIFIESFQSAEINKDNSNLYSQWGEHHFDIHIYRNSELFPDFKKHEKICIKDLYSDFKEWYSRGHNENARRDWIEEFLLSVIDGNVETKSNLLNHRLSITLFNTIYDSINHNYNWESPLVHISI